MISPLRKLNCLLILGALCQSGFAASITDTLDGGPGTFRPLDAATWAWSSTAGVNGTGALINTRTNAANYTYASRPVTLRPQSSFRFSAWVKGTNIAGADAGSGLILQHVANTGWLSADNPLMWVKGTTPSWQRVEGYGYSNPSENPNAADLALFLQRGMTGTTTYDNITLEELGNVPTFNGSFNADLNGWSLQSNEWSRDATGGRNGTGALLLNRTNSSATGAAILPIASAGLDLSIPYHFAAWVRGENVQGNGKGGYIDAEYNSPSTWLGWDDSTTGTGNGTTGWKRIEGIAAPLRGTTGINLDLFLANGMTGKVWFDDLELQPLVTTGNLASFAALNPAAAAPVAINNPNFANDLGGWNFSASPSGFSHAPSEGTGGSGGVKIVKSDANAWIYCYQLVNLLPGYIYTIHADIRTANMAGGGYGAYVGMDHSGAAGWLGGDSSTGVTGNTGWTHVTGTTYARRGETSSMLYFGLPAGASGNVWFDNISVVPTSIRPLQVAILTPGNQTLMDNDGGLLLAVNGADVAGYDSRLAKLLVRRGGVVVAERDYLLRDDRINADLGRLPAAAYELELSIIDLHAQATLASTVIPFNVASSNRSVPANAAWIDRRGRMMVANNPYMPVGIYVSDQLERADIDALAATNAFNTLLPYISPILRFTGTSQGDIGAVNEVLDYANSKNLKVLFGLSDLLPENRGWISSAPTILGVTNTQRNWTPTTTEAENSALVDTAVASFKTHPALLGWYTQDEQAFSRIPFLATRRQRLNQLDPFHSVLGATFAALDFPAYRSTWDIGSMDYYPVGAGLSDFSASEFLSSTKSIADAMRVSGESSLSWGITQAHNIGFYQSPSTTLRFPTVTEMRAMSLAQAIHGMKGFLFYAYTELKLNSTPTTLNQRLQNVAEAARTLRLFEPYLMSTQTPSAQPQIFLSGGRVVFRSFKDNNGNTGVALSGFSNPNAVITMPAGTGPLRSIYGCTTSLGNQQYRFIGSGTQADLLMP